jgi:phage terminase small subunit
MSKGWPREREVKLQSRTASTPVFERMLRNVPRSESGEIIQHPMSERHMDLVDYYMDGLSMKQCMLSVGYKEATATANAARTFRRKDVVAEIAWRREQLKKRYDISEERILEEMAAIAFTNYGDIMEIAEDGTAYVDLTKMTDEHKRAISEITTEEYKEDRTKDGATVLKTKVKFYSKLDALQMLARTLGMFNDRIDVNVNVNIMDALDAGRKRLALAKDVTPYSLQN